MNKFVKLLGLPVAILSVASLSSCSSEAGYVQSPANQAGGGVNLINAPEVYGYSGSRSLDSFSAISTEDVLSWEFVTTTAIDREKEAEIIDEWLPEQNGNLRPELDTDFLFVADKDLTFDLYPVYSQTSTENSLGVFYFDANGDRHDVIVWDKINPYDLTDTKWEWSEELGSYAVVSSKGIRISVKEGYRFGFFWKGHTNTVETTYYSISELNEEVNCTDGNGNPLGEGITSQIHAVTFDLDGKTYLGLEDWTDFDFQDWVFTCPEGLRTVEPDDRIPGGEVVTPEQPEEPANPDTPEVSRKTDHVEVNLSLENRNSYLTAHLSIHVRSNTDVRVFIPMKAEYYCDTDDMAIVQKHEEEFFVHGGPNVTEYTINGQTVTLTVEFTDEGIYVTTDGITEELIAYLDEHNGDGLTFEVWLYTNLGTDGYTPQQIEEIRDELNSSTVEFLDNLPGLYVNAFNDTDEGEKFGDDFTVTIVDGQNGAYDNGTEGWWFNDSEYNWLFYKK